MPFSPEQIAKIKEKDNALSDAMRRDPNVDYYHGWFFVTLNTRNNVPVLSTCIGNPNIPDGQQDAPKCEYSEVGKGVLAAWQRNQTIYDNVTVDICEAMPEHFHGLLYLNPGNKKHLGQIIKGFMIGCSHAYWDTLGIDWRSMAYQKGVRTPQYEDKDHTKSFRGPALFVHGYNDMEPVSPEEVEVKRAYIRDQARKRLIQGDRHLCFHKLRHQHSNNWTTERVMTAISIDRTFRTNQERCTNAQNNVITRLIKDTKGIGLDIIGDKTLLYSPHKLPLISHSADALLFDEQKEAVLKAARAGSLIVSAFISKKERDIKQQLIVEMLPFIEITDNGFSDKYKGIGKAFYALAEKRLVQITPWTYLYHKGGVSVSREMCLVMNELARVITGVRDDWWKTR